METRKQVLGIIGSYRKGGVIDSAVSEVLAAAAELGTGTTKIYLTEQQVEFCRNCRSCTQEPGPVRGECVVDDEMDSILQQIDQADGLVLGAPINFGNNTAITKRFLERLIRYTYWPWGGRKWPVLRDKQKSKKAVLVTSSACPALLGRLLMNPFSVLKNMANMLGAKRIGTLYVGLVSDPHPKLPQNVIRKARSLGKKLGS